MVFAVRPLELAVGTLSAAWAHAWSDFRAMFWATSVPDLEVHVKHIMSDHFWLYIRVNAIKLYSHSLSFPGKYTLT